MHECEGRAVQLLSEVTENLTCPPKYLVKRHFHRLLCLQVLVTCLEIEGSAFQLQGWYLP